MFGFWTGVVGSACLLIGVLLGTMLPRRGEWRARAVEAPAPADLGYDPGNPINGRHAERGESEEICGMTFYRM